MKEEKISINEQDLFNYIFFPENLSDEKKEMIGADKSLGEILEFYRKLRTGSESLPDKSLKERIADKIPAYTLPGFIQLHPLKDSGVTKPNGSRLAADSKELTAKMTSKTFVDNEKEYLIKVLNYSNMTKVFVFSAKNETVKNFNLIIEPQNLHYHLDDNSEPLMIDQSIEAESIRLEII